MKESNRTTLYVNFNHLIKFEPFELYEIIHQEFFKYESSVVKAVYNFISSQHRIYAKEKLRFNISFYNNHAVDNIRSLKTEKLGQLISIQGTLTKTTEIRPELVIGAFKCG